ncbi:hypothetical protein [Thermus thalpophilus]|uniref:hypothetical protein n=1 Tax=Thermus thalpophilus TaxID=2908147 RepID=UPI001FAAE46D|nr:hypothetical protein [Thermus thalpophilus]
MNLLSPHIALYRLFDLADEIDLSRLSTPRLRLSRARLGAVRFQNPPAEVELGVRSVEGLSGLLTARLYEFGVVSLSFRIHLGERVPWEVFLEKGLKIPELPFWDGFFLAELAALEPYLKGALLRPEEKRLSEEFAVYHALGLEGAKAHDPPVDLTPLWMGTAEEFAPEVRREMERYRYSYSTEDLALLGFDRVLILDSEGIWDVADLVEFVHAQLLELSYYDRLLTEELEAVPEVLKERGLWGYGKLQRLSRRLMARHAEIAHVRARMEGALRITEDLFYAKIYRAALELYGAHELERSVEEKLRVLEATYEMVTEEVAHLRTQAVEVAILALIAFEVFRALH